MEATEPVEVIRSNALGSTPHGFLTRRGGVSQGVAASLNVGLGAGDDPVAVAENRRRACAAIGAAIGAATGAATAPETRLVTVYQTHSPDAVHARAPWPQDQRPKADAIVTDQPGLLLGIVTADCAPVLLVDREAGVIGAAHAGWRGAAGGVLDNTVAAMENLGASASRIIAAVGPAIAQTSYEVDDGFREVFEALAGTNTEARPGIGADAFFAPGRPGHWQFNLAGYVAHRLRHCGVVNVDDLGLDTYSAPDRFFSYRRATHRNEPGYGRQFSLIGLS